MLVLFVFEEKLTSWAFGIFSSSVLAQAKRGSSICETVNFSNSCRTCAFNFILRIIFFKSLIEIVKWARNSYFFRFGSFSFILLRHSAWNGSFISENGVDRWVPESEFIFGLKCRLKMTDLSGFFSNSSKGKQYIHLGLLAGRFGRCSFLWGIIFCVGSSWGYDWRNRNNWALSKKPSPASLKNCF